MKTDYEKLKEVFDEIGIEYDEYEDAEAISIIVKNNTYKYFDFTFEVPTGDYFFDPNKNGT
jgi:hypothetical protein